MDRAGVLPALPEQPGSELPAVSLAQMIHQLPGLKFSGLMAYEGHLLQQQPDKDLKIKTAIGSLVATRHAIEAAGIPVAIVSCGGTGSYQASATVPGVTESQAGGGVFSDLLYEGFMGLTGHEIALTCLTTVTSRPTNSRVIIDAGRKTLCHFVPCSMPAVLLPALAQCNDSSDHAMDGTTKGSHVRVLMTELCAEHGVFELPPECEQKKADIGARLNVIPGYHDLTVVLHDRFVACRGNQVEAIWDIEARGRLD